MMLKTASDQEEVLIHEICGIQINGILVAVVCRGLLGTSSDYNTKASNRASTFRYDGLLITNTCSGRQ